MFKNFEWKRALSIVLFTVAEAVPQLLPFKPVILAVASALGGVGIIHGVIKEGRIKKKVAALQREVDVLSNIQGAH